MVLPALSPEWKEQMQALAYHDLRAEIEREETELGELYQSLYDADERIGELEDEIGAESQREESRRFIERQRVIRRLERRIAERQARIENLTRRALELERMPIYISVVQRYIRLEVAASLWRSVHALQGWQTRERRSLAAYKGWQTRELPYTERIRLLLEALARWRKEADGLAAQIRIVEAQIVYKKSILPVLVLSRVSIALYLIIERGEHVYPRHKPHYDFYDKERGRYRKVRHKVSYPKGRFQSILACDSFINPDTGEIRADIDPFNTLERVIRTEVADEFMEEFSLKTLDPNDLTLGETSIIPDEEEIGKPPFKLYISRTYEDTGREWRTTINKYIMTDAQYYELTKDMKDYIAALEAMG